MASAEEKVAASPTGTELAEKIVGTWELVSYKVEDKDTGKLIEAMGPTPRGRVIFTKDGWVAFNLEGSDRQPAKTEAERAELMKTLVAYIGRYRIEGDQWVTSVQTAWAPEWVGTEQRRTIKLDGDYADVVTPWRKMPNWDVGHLSHSVIRFKRAQ
ncbi:lipocalin-like domain-containing protein [Methylorubrum aminovorans]|nr:MULTISPECIES: lipocalin-like domain-containing protein [Methylobacteriaceae]